MDFANYMYTFNSKGFMNSATDLHAVFDPPMEDDMIDPFLFVPTMPQLEPYGEEDFKLLVEEDMDRTRTLFDEVRTKLAKAAPKIWKDPETALAAFDTHNGTEIWKKKYGYISLIKYPEVFGALAEKQTSAKPTTQARLLAKAFVHDNLTLHLLELLGGYFANAQDIIDFWARRDEAAGESADKAE